MFSAYSTGALIGGLIAIYVLHMLWEFILFKRVFNDPVAGKLLSVVAAYCTSSAIYGFAAANGGPYRWDGFTAYLIPALVVGIFAGLRGMRLRKEIEAEEA
ncbi:hypothetical protein ACFQ1E_18375 [Sphingomonas canadensis]|uniref:Uncharacterized protein n=1 Tax=Sphingomonas canadensis TaxID=1219257 RepID=A0ABW3H9Z5_9SPHN|nr:hypothetical protein [Sphingomonas canadensis]MCW3837892.1 hypothetical protein [Sphingomonas canadensis]